MMKEYMQPEVEFVDFKTEPVADVDVTSGEGYEDLD